MVYTLVLEASAERIESSSLSGRTTIRAVSDNGSTCALQAWSGSSILPRSTNFRKYMKTRKPRNHVHLALSKCNGSGSHQKTHKQLRGQWKRNMDV